MTFLQMIPFGDGKGHMLKIGKRVLVQVMNEWYQLSPRRHFHWLDFTLIKFSFEMDKMARNYCLECIIFGLGIFIQVDYDFEHSMIKRLADDAFVEVNEP